MAFYSNLSDYVKANGITILMTGLFLLVVSLIADIQGAGLDQRAPIH